MRCPRCRWGHLEGPGHGCAGPPSLLGRLVVSITGPGCVYCDHKGSVPTRTDTHLIRVPCPKCSPPWTPKRRAPSPRRRAEQLIDECCLAAGPALVATCFGSEEREREELRRILAAEFRKVRRAALLRAATLIREASRDLSLHAAEQWAFNEALHVVTALAKLKKRGRRG